MRATTTPLLRAIHPRPQAASTINVRTRFFSTKNRVAVLPGSARDHANNPGIQHWVAETVKKQAKPVDVVVADLRKPPMKLGPITDATMPAAVRDPARYAQEATRAWSAFVTSCDSIVVVSPEYNGSYPGELKNAFDHLYWEWRGKNVVLVTYGGGGGIRCAAQLRSLVEGLKMNIMGEVGVKLPAEYVSGNERVPADTGAPNGSALPEFLVEKQAVLDAAIEALLAKNKAAPEA